MELHVRAHSVEIDNDTREYVEAKVGRPIKKLLRGLARVDVELTELAKGGGATLHRAKVHVAIPHANSETVTVEDADLRAAIDKAADKIARAIKKNKSKRRGKVRTGSMPAACR